MKTVTLQMADGQVAGCIPLLLLLSKHNQPKKAGALLAQVFPGKDKIKVIYLPFKAASEITKTMKRCKKKGLLNATQ